MPSPKVRPTPHDAPTQSHEDPWRIGPYEVGAEIARGGNATVYRAVDSRDQSTCALKVLHDVGEASASGTRFRREFRALSRLFHPNVLRVHDHGVQRGRPWFAMELVPGQHLGEAAAAWSHLAPTERFTRVHSALVQAARALDYVHSRGLVHRDVSPNNLIVTDEGVVKLMDFGLVSDHDAHITGAGDILGTLAHTPPETFRGETVDARSDLYSLGTVLYLLLTGRKPFFAHTARGYIDKHLLEMPKQPRELEPLVPPLLDRVCMRLLEKDPARRFASAAHLLHVLGDATPTSADDRWPPRTVGRTDVTAWARDAIDDVVARTSGDAIWVHGPGGMGKTRLLDLIADEARRRGLLVARGRCRQHDRPFGAYGSVYRDLATEGDPEILKSTFSSEGGGQAERYLVEAAFRDAVVRRAPCVILLDDLEHADAATRDLTDFLIRNTLELADQPVLLVLASQTPDTERSLPWQRYARVHQAELGPLSTAEVEEVVLSLLPEDAGSRALAARLYDETQGHPGMVAEMLRGLADDGALARVDGRWTLQISAPDVATSNLPLPDSLRTLLQDRLGPLGGDAVEVGRTIALALRSLDLDALIEAVPFDEDRTLVALDALVDADVVVERRRQEVDRVELAHGRFRDILVEGLEPDDRRRRHQRLGEIVERKNRHATANVLEGLAYHFEQAGVPPKAYAYLLLTAQKHLQLGLQEEGLHFLDRALRMEPLARPFLLLDQADRSLAELRLDRARALYDLGRWGEALEDAEQAKALALPLDDATLLAQVHAEIGKYLWNRAQVRPAEASLEAAVASARRGGLLALLPAPLYHLGAIAWSRGQLEQAQTLWEESLDLARDLHDVPAEGRAHMGLGILAVCRGQAREARVLIERSAELFEGLGDVRSLAFARINLVELYVCSGQLRKAQALTERLTAQALEAHHVHALALALVWRARILLVVGRPEEARAHAEHALRTAQELGTVDDQAQALETLLQVLLKVGEPEVALMLTDALDEALAEADHEGMADQALALRARALIASGRRTDAAAVLAQVAETPSYPHITIRRDLDLADAWGELGEQERAMSFARRALADAESSRYRFYSLLAHQTLHRHAPDPEARMAHGRRARDLARSFAATLDVTDSASFLARGWGVTDHTDR